MTISNFMSVDLEDYYCDLPFSEWSTFEPRIEQKEILFKMPQKKPIVPSQREVKENPPSRSAKLRYLIKQEDVFDIDTDILEKFHYLLEVENLGSKLWKDL